MAGFNEHITTYGWDDDDLYDRLEGTGVVRVSVNPQMIYHQPHSDEAHTGREHAADQKPTAFAEITESTLYCIRRNCFLAKVMPEWDERRTHVPFIFIEAPDGGEVLRRAGPPRHLVPPQIEADADYYALLELAAWLRGSKVLGLDRAPLKSLLSQPFDAISGKEIEMGADKGAPLDLSWGVISPPVPPMS